VLPALAVKIGTEIVIEVPVIVEAARELPATKAIAAKVTAPQAIAAKVIATKVTAAKVAVAATTTTTDQNDAAPVMVCGTCLGRERSASQHHNQGSHYGSVNHGFSHCSCPLTSIAALRHAFPHVEDWQSSGVA
jgi:hypothetical protein